LTDDDGLADAGVTEAAGVIRLTLQIEADMGMGSAFSNS
jgi:hypothetical protein